MHDRCELCHNSIVFFGNNQYQSLCKAVRSQKDGHICVLTTIHVVAERPFLPLPWKLVPEFPIIMFAGNCMGQRAGNKHYGVLCANASREAAEDPCAHFLCFSLLL